MVGSYVGGKIQMITTVQNTVVITNSFKSYHRSGFGSLGLSVVFVEKWLSRFSTNTTQLPIEPWI